MPRVRRVDGRVVLVGETQAVTWDDLQLGILEDFARLQEVSYVDRETAAIDRIMESRREAVRNYRARLAPDEKRRQSKERWARRKTAPGFKERERERVNAWKRTRGMRERLADEREGVTHHFTIIAQKPRQEGDDPNAPPDLYEVDGYLTTGTYGDGRLGEVFLKLGRHGGEQAVYDAWATAASVALQHGTDVNNLFSKWVGISFEPSGATKNPNVPRAASILDYVARFLIQNYNNK